MQEPSTPVALRVAVPESSENEPLIVTERPTVELCGAEHRTWHCILSRGHEGQHQALTATSVYYWTEPPVETK